MQGNHSCRKEEEQGCVMRILEEKEGSKNGRHRKIACPFLDGQDRQKDSTSLIASFSLVYISSFIFIYVQLDPRQIMLQLQYFNTVLGTRQVRFWRNNFILNGNKDLTTRRTIQMYVSILLKFKKQFKIAIISIMNKLGLLSIQKYIQ